MDPLILLPITAIFVVAMVVGRNELVRRRLLCPRTGRAADVEFLQRSLRPDKLVAIRSCSLLADPHRVDCGRQCLKSGK